LPVKQDGTVTTVIPSDKYEGKWFVSDVSADSAQGCASLKYALVDDAGNALPQGGFVAFDGTNIVI
jgi:hypothetical protein